MKSAPRGFAGFVKGTNKEVLARVYATKGRDAAFVKAAELGVKNSTSSSWFSNWNRHGFDQSKTKDEADQG